jgi:hypothetical protein
MCGASRGPILRHMDGTTTAISLDMHLAGDCLTGTATSAAGVERPFCGWLGLIAVFDEFLQPTSNDGAPPLTDHLEDPSR